MSRPFISVVMPVYGVEQSVARAAQSVLNQSFADLELILVDDCSPDRSGAICDEIAQTDQRVQVLHLEHNGGLSRARNSGMQLAGGRYILFMDSDDYLDQDALQIAVDSLQNNPAKLVVWGLIEEYYDTAGRLAETVRITYPACMCATAEQLRAHIIYLEEKTLLGYQWNKLYDFDYLQDKQLQYETVPLIEDILFSIAFVQDIDSMNVLDIAPYHYQKKTDAGLTSKFVPAYYELHMRRIEKMLELYQGWGLCNDEVKQILAGIYVRYVTSAIQRNCDKRSGLSGKQQRAFIQSVYTSELYNELMPYAAPQSRIVKMLSGFLKSKNTAACYLCGKAIYAVKTKLPVLFARAKQNR